MPPPGFHSSAIQDDLSTCSSPIPWPPKPVPAPSFEIPALEVKDLTWEHCTSILYEPPRKNFLALCGSDRGSSKSERFTPVNVVGSPEIEPPKDGLFSLPESECPRSPTAASSISYDSQSFRDLDSIPPLSRQPGGSLLKRIFRPLGKSRLSRSCKPPSPGKRAKSPPARLSCADLGFDADPRVSSTNVINDAGGLMDMETGVYASDRLARWLHNQQWQAMVCKAQSHLNELQSLLDMVVRSMNDLREMDEYAKEVRQKQTRCYFAS